MSIYQLWFNVVLVLLLSVQAFKLPSGKHNAIMIHCIKGRSSAVKMYHRYRSISTLRDSLDKFFGSESISLLPIHGNDVAHLSELLQNVTTVLPTNPAYALTLASQNLEWLLSRNIPKLTEAVIEQNPLFDNTLGSSYAFIMDFLESVTTETSELMKRNQVLMKSLFLALKSTDGELEKFITDHAVELTTSEFMMYLQAEISNQEPQSEMHSLLTTLHLRLLDECGKKWGVDVRALPRLAAEDDAHLRKKKVLEHIVNYDHQGRLLFIQTIRMMLSELRTRYQNVDPQLVINLEDIERIVSQNVGGKLK